MKRKAISKKNTSSKKTQCTQLSQNSQPSDNSENNLIQSPVQSPIEDQDVVLENPKVYTLETNLSQTLLNNKTTSTDTNKEVKEVNDLKDIPVPVSCKITSTPSNNRDTELLIKICNQFGIAYEHKELLEDYIISKKEKLLLSYNCIGIVTLDPTSYIKDGVLGLFRYIQKVTELKIVVIAMAFGFMINKEDTSLMNSLKYLTEDNLFLLRNSSIDFEIVIARTKFWKIFINSLYHILMSENQLDTIGENNWEELFVMLNSLFSKPKFDDFKYAETTHYIKTIGSSKYTKQTVTVPLFNNMNHENNFNVVKDTIITYWQQPYHKSKTLNKNLNTLLDKQRDTKQAILEKGYIDFN